MVGLKAACPRRRILSNRAAIGSFLRMRMMYFKPDVLSRALTLAEEKGRDYPSLPAAVEMSGFWE